MWQPPGVGQQQQRQPASSEGLRLAGVGLSAGGEASLWVEGKQCKCTAQASCARRHEAAPTVLPNSPAHLLHPGTCPAAQAPNWIQDMDTSEVPKEKNRSSTGRSSTLGTRAVLDSQHSPWLPESLSYLHSWSHVDLRYI